MTFFIPIDRTTIQQNPNAGRQHYQVPGRQSIDLYYTWHKPSLPPGLTDACLHSYGATATHYKIHVILSELPKNLDEIMTNAGIAKDAYEYTLHREVQTVHLLNPEPSHFYSYIPTEVECRACHAKFPHTELEADVCGSYDDEYYSQRVCPKCGEFDCCEIELEKLEGKA